MSKVTKKTVKIKESELVDMIDNIVNEAIAVKKQEWLNEQAKKQSNKTTVLENKIAKLEAAVKSLTEGKKK
jgi:prophage DNA circulation protein